MKSFDFFESAWEEYIYWQNKDKKNVKKDNHFT